MKNLYNLIHKLTQSEKRYVKLRLQATKSSSQSLQYFDTIAHQRKYNFEDLELLDNKSTPVLRSNLDKLYRSILKQLRIFHAEASSEVRLQGILSDVNLLQEKGLIKEAKKLNVKLVKYAEEEEVFGVLRKALSNQWLLNHLSGTLTPEITQWVEDGIAAAQLKEQEIEQLNALYRKAVSNYYAYFFKEKKEAYLVATRALLQHERLKNKTFKSANAEMVFYEITAIGNIMLGDLAAHHETRKSQLSMLFTADIFKKDYINKLLVTSNLFTYLKNKNKFVEFSHYLDFFENYFGKVIQRNNEPILVEKYYDVFFQNKIYQQQFALNSKRITTLVNDFKVLVESKTLSNKILISRTYLSLAELLLLIGEERKVIPLLIEYQDWDKTNKTSKSFIDSELLFLQVYWRRQKNDAFDAKIIYVDKQLSTAKISLDDEQAVVLKLLKRLKTGEDVTNMVLDDIKKQSTKLLMKQLNPSVNIDKMNIDFDDDFVPSSDKLLVMLRGK